MPSDRLSLRVYLLSITSPLWQVWQRTTKTFLLHQTPPSALILKHSERKKLPDHQQVPPKQSYCSKTKWSLTIFLFSRINITKGPWKRFHFPQRGAVCGDSDGIGLEVVSGRVSRWDGVRFNGSALHVGDELVRDLGQHVFSQPRHAQHVVACAVHVVSERHKLSWNGKEIYDFMKRMFHVCNESNRL